jgi:phosphoribulokinase
VWVEQSEKSRVRAAFLEGSDVRVVNLAHLERIASSLAIRGQSREVISARLGLSAQSIEKLLENVCRKISRAEINHHERKKP